MPRFFLTIGVQYSHEPHPLGIHPDGYVVVEADDELKGREMVFDLMGTKWSMLYDEDEFFSDSRFDETRTCDYFPRGCLGTIKQGGFVSA